MAYQAPDPEQFSGMEQAYSFMAPLSAVNITLPSFVFGGPCGHLSRIIYLNQCNPGEILKGAATWLVLAQKFDEAREAMQARIDGFPAEDWRGEDRDAYDKKAQQIVNQLENMHAFAMHLGISLFAIGLILAVMIPIMLAISTALMAMAVFVLAVQYIPGPGQALAATWRATAMAFATQALAVLKMMDNAAGAAGKTLAAFIAANMTVSWINMAANGNIISPASTIGSTGYSLLQGLAQLAVIRVMAPGKGAAKGGTGTAGGSASGSGTAGAASGSGTAGAASTSGTAGAASGSGAAGAASGSGAAGAASGSGAAGATAGSTSAAGAAAGGTSAAGATAGSTSAAGAAAGSTSTAGAAAGSGAAGAAGGATKAGAGGATAGGTTAGGSGLFGTAGSVLDKAGPALLGGVGAQGIYNIGNSAAGDGAENKMTDAGVDALNYDFIPDGFGDSARAGDEIGSWRPDGSKPEPDKEETSASASDRN